MAQPALSKEIRNLETEVGVQLLERRARGVRLTAAGEAFLLEAADDGCASHLIIGRAPFVVYAAKVAELLIAVHRTDPSINVQVVQLSDPLTYPYIRSDHWPELARRLELSSRTIHDRSIVGHLESTSCPRR